MSAILVDWSQPIELDDGTPATLIYVPGDARRRVKITHSPYREADQYPNIDGTWWYSETGVWNGGDRERNYYVRNKLDKEEDYVSDFG